jgi:hypothetical protein
MKWAQECIKEKKITLAERHKCDVSRTANAAGFQLAEGGQHDHIALSI